MDIYRFLKNVYGDTTIYVIIISYAACGCCLHGCAADAVPPVYSKMVLIFPTSEGWQAESTHLVLFNGTIVAQTQNPNILNQPPEPLSQHQAD